MAQEVLLPLDQQLIEPIEIKRDNSIVEHTLLVDMLTQPVLTALIRPAVRRASREKVLPQEQEPP